MFKVDVTAVHQFQRYLRALPEQEARAFVRNGYTEAVMQASQKGDVDFIKRLEGSAKGNRGSLRVLREGQVRETPSNIPAVIRIARRMAEETGRAPRIKMRLPEPVPGVRAWTEAILLERK